MRLLPLLGAALIVTALGASLPAVRAAAPAVGPCTIFPADNVWNTPIDTLPVDARSAAYVSSIGAGTGLKADFGAGAWDGGPIGIPYTTVPGSQPRVPVSFTWADESDPGPYPIPPDAPIEGGPNSDGDRHVLVVDTGACRLYETYNSWPQGDGSWRADSGAVFDLSSNALRPETWTSADAAGLPILPGLVRYDEVASGEIRHALRFTVPRTRRAYVWPARHYASSLTDPNLPPMGQRFRLRADFDISGFSPTNQVILRALKTYGMFLADNGSAWYLSGAPDERWNNDELRQLLQVPGSAFEAVDESSLMVDPNSARVRSTSPMPSPSPPPPSPTPAPSASPKPSPSPTPSTPPSPTPTPTPSAALPSAPTNPRITDVTSSTLTVAWTDTSANEDRFVVSYRRGGAWSEVNAPANATSWTLTGLARNANYSVRVRACNAAGCSAWTATVSAKTGR